MKLLVMIGLVIWLICGVAGAWMIYGREDLRWKAIARGPLTLVKAFNEKPVTYPGP